MTGVPAEQTRSVQSVEFLDVDPIVHPDAADGTGSHTGLRVAAGIAAVIALGLAALTLRDPGASAPVAATSAPTPTAVARTAPARNVAPVPASAAEIVYLGGCNGCVRVAAIPVGVRFAVLDAFGSPEVDATYTVISATNGQLFARGVHGMVGRGSFEIEVALDPTNRVGSSRVAGATRVASVRAGDYVVTVRTHGIRVSLARLLHLAGDPVMTADR